METPKWRKSWGLWLLATEQRLLLCNYRAGSALETGSSGKAGEMVCALGKGIAQMHRDLPWNRWWVSWELVGEDQGTDKHRWHHGRHLLQTTCYEISSGWLEEASWSQAWSPDLRIWWEGSRAGCKQPRRFLESIKNNFLTQLADQGRYYSGLLLMTKEELVKDVKMERSLVCSDHETVKLTILRGLTKIKSRIKSLNVRKQILVCPGIYLAKSHGRLLQRPRRPGHVGHLQGYLPWSTRMAHSDNSGQV